MNPDELKTLQKQVRKLKRIAGESAMALHDLVEDGLPGAYEQLPELAETTYRACRDWAEANARLESAET